MSARSGKRKACLAETSEGEIHEDLTPALKRAKPSRKDIASKGSEVAEMPTNKVLPPSISYPRTLQGAARIVAWNVCKPPREPLD